MLLSVNQISKLTGRDRHGIPKRLENLPFTPGDKGAHLYESRDARLQSRSFARWHQSLRRSPNSNRVF
jgi:hypothetical protein